jgi:Anti-anti-sigma regulatory factor (antagonist of anti-sigma factor)
MLNTTMNLEGTDLTVVLEGRLDALTSQSLEKEIEGYFEKINSITVDCAKLEYISSAGLRTLLAAQQYMEEQGYENVKVVNANEVILDIFEETGFSDILDVVR